MQALPDLYEKLWDAVTSQRAIVSAARDRLLQTKVLLQLGVNVASAAAEVAFVADAEFVAAALNDKINKYERDYDNYSVIGSVHSSVHADNVHYADNVNYTM